MRPLHALTAMPAVLVLLAAVAVAWGARNPVARFEAVSAGMDVGRARASLMATIPVGTPVDAALSTLRDLGMSCALSEPPLANLTWPVVVCSTMPTSLGATLKIDVAGRNRVVADIGVENLSCMSRADIVDPDPAPVDCDLSSGRLLAVEAQRRAGARSLLADVLGGAAPTSAPRR